MEPKIRHLEMIQGAIDGAAGNSLRIKGIAMLLFAGTIAFLLRGGESTSVISFPLAIVLLLTVFLLGLLDYHFVRQSDLLRILYDRVRLLSEGDINFSMEVKQYSDVLSIQYNLDPPIPIIATVTFYTCAFLTVIIAALN